MKSIMSPKYDGFLKYLLKNTDNVLFRNNIRFLIDILFPILD